MEHETRWFIVARNATDTWAPYDISRVKALKFLKSTLNAITRGNTPEDTSYQNWSGEWSVAVGVPFSDGVLENYTELSAFQEFVQRVETEVLREQLNKNGF
jgi:hypothetical protein